MCPCSWPHLKNSWTELELVVGSTKIWVLLSGWFQTQSLMKTCSLGAPMKCAYVVGLTWKTAGATCSSWEFASHYILCLCLVSWGDNLSNLFTNLRVNDLSCIYVYREPKLNASFTRSIPYIIKGVWERRAVISRRRDLSQGFPQTYDKYELFSWALIPCPTNAPKSNGVAHPVSGILGEALLSVIASKCMDLPAF